MKSLIPFLIAATMIFSGGIAAAESDTEKTADNKEAPKSFDADRLKCAWNKTPEEIEEHCNKPVKEEEKVANKLDSRLKKDAKTVKKFFGIGKDEGESTSK